MMYDYETEKPKLFTDEGQRTFLKVRDEARELLRIAGAFRYQELLNRAAVGGDSFFQLACVDRLVELGEIVAISRDCWAQYRVFSDKKVHDF